MKKILGLFFCVSFAFAQETDNRQETIISALDSIEENSIGFALNGRAKGGIFSSVLKSDDLDKSNSDYLAFTDFLLGISVRPSKETKATFDLRFHKDWQSAYREGNNSPIVRWWSYDGNILNKKLKFNLGTMRIAYTPLTVYLPEPELIMEPEIFSNLKKEAMEERYLDGTNRRLLQGLNVEFRESVGILDNILLQGTIMRLHKMANINDRISYDFDSNKERFSTAARAGIETFGFSLSVNDVYTFDRISSAWREDSLNYENNNVLSFELGYNGKKLLSGPVNFGIDLEYALSNWKHSVDKERSVLDSVLKVDGTDIDGLVPSNTRPGNDKINRYPYYEIISKKKYNALVVDKQYNKGAFFADAFVSFEQSLFETKLSGHFLNTDENFEAELAASPAYLPNLPILNSGASLNSAFDQFRTGSLEYMYYSLYYSLPMNAMTVVSGLGGKPTLTDDALLYNNYKFSQYYRNAYTQQTYSRLERSSESYYLDPAVNLALPFGYATPDRQGGDADLSVSLMKAINLRGVFGSYSSKNSGDYTRLGGGLEVDVAKLIGLSNAMVISGSYEQNKEEKGIYNPKIDRIMAGANIGIWRGLSFIGGFQQLSKKFKEPYMGVDETGEVLAIGGPQVKISEKAKFSLQGGLLSNSISAKDVAGNKLKLDLDKYIASGVVTVEF